MFGQGPPTRRRSLSPVGWGADGLDGILLHVGEFHSDVGNVRPAVGKRFLHVGEVLLHRGEVRPDRGRFRNFRGGVRQNRGGLDNRWRVVCEHPHELSPESDCLREGRDEFHPDAGWVAPNGGAIRPDCGATRLPGRGQSTGVFVVSTAMTYFNDGIGPDPYPSRSGTFPFTATDSQVYRFSSVGNYEMKFTVSDDDGGSTAVLVTIRIGGWARYLPLLWVVRNVGLLDQSQRDLSRGRRSQRLGELFFIDSSVAEHLADYVPAQPAVERHDQEVASIWVDKPPVTPPLAPHGPSEPGHSSEEAAPIDLPGQSRHQTSTVMILTGSGATAPGDFADFPDEASSR